MFYKNIYELNPTPSIFSSHEDGATSTSFCSMKLSTT